MHAHFASILVSILEGFLANFGSENRSKMETKFNVFWHLFLIPFSNVCGRCFLNFSHIFASCYDVIFDAEPCVFLKCLDFAFCKIT